MDFPKLESTYYERKEFIIESVTNENQMERLEVKGEDRILTEFIERRKKSENGNQKTKNRNQKTGIREIKK